MSYPGEPPVSYTPPVRPRRSEKSIADRAAIDAVIRECRVCRLGLADGDEPYVVPLCFGYDGTSLYFHAAPVGRKIDIIRRNSLVCVEFDILDSMREAERPCAWGARYRSVIAFGRATLVEDPAAKRRALKILMAHYSRRDFSFPNEAVDRTAVIRVDIDRITGKRS